MLAQDRAYILALGAVLIAVGAGIAILVLPDLFNSIFWFSFFGGLGIFAGYQIKNIRGVLSLGLGIIAWIYFFITVGFLAIFNYALLIDSSKILVPTFVLATLAVAWLGRNRIAADRKTLSAFKKIAVFTLLIVTPLIIAGLHDYNIRADSSQPRLVTLVVVDKYTELRGTSDSTTEHYMLRGNSTDGRGWFEIDVSYTFYEEHDIGSLCNITVRDGALGYRWLEGYR